MPTTDRVSDLSMVLDALRSGTAVTQPQLTALGLGRTVVTQRVSELQAAGLVVQDGSAASTGGRAARQLRFRAEAGIVVAIECGAIHASVAVADLGGNVLAQSSIGGSISDGPAAVLGRAEQAIDELLGHLDGPREVWAIGVGLPGPVEYATGRPVAPPIMPGWDGYPVRQRLADRYGAPVWVDNDVNVIALGELRTNPVAAQSEDILCVKVGTGIGAGLISQGRVHRGANGCAGDIGHIAVPEGRDVVCRCGNTGCLEAVAGGGAIARDGHQLALDGRSAFLAQRLAESGRVTAADVVAASHAGDPGARALILRSGRVIGATLATLVSFFNPGLVVLSGGIVEAGDHVTAAVREGIYRRSLPLATRSLRIETTALGGRAGLIGAMHLGLDGIFAPAVLAAWLANGSPHGQPGLAELAMANVA